MPIITYFVWVVFTPPFGGVNNDAHHTHHDRNLCDVCADLGDKEPPHDSTVRHDHAKRDHGGYATLPGEFPAVVGHIDLSLRSGEERTIYYSRPLLTSVNLDKFHYFIFWVVPYFF